MKLTYKSKQLMSYFKNNKLLFFTKNTNKTNKILTAIYNKIYDAYNYLQDIKNKGKYLNINVKKINNSSQIVRPNNFSFQSFPDIVKNHIHKTSTYEITYDFSLYSRNIKIFFIVEDTEINAHLEQYTEYVNHMIMWLYILNNVASKTCATSLSIYLYFTSLEKHLPKSNDLILNEMHVNTAFTTSCPKISEIVVYRREEWFKVFIHESFHNFGLDFSDMNTDISKRCILNIFKVKSEVNLFESYTEFWAEILNALFCSFFKLKNKNNINEFLSNAEILINYDKTYSFFQLVKILNYMGLTYNNLYLNDKISKIQREKYKENTNVLSYYIIKAILMDNYQGFLSWCNTNNYSLFQFKKTLTSQMNYCKFIEKNYKSISMLENIEKTKIFFDKIASKNKNNYLLTNMRMSICELG